MIRKIVFGLAMCFFFTLFIPCLTSLTACTDTNEIDIEDVPCQGITVVLPCAGNISVTNLNTSDKFNMTTFSMGGNLYNFTVDEVNFTEASYSLVDCGNNTATLLVGDFPRDDLWKAAIMVGLLGMAFVIITMARISFEKDRWVLKTMMYVFGSLISLITIQTGLIFSRVSNIDTMMTTALVIIITAISIFVMYILIYYTIGLIKAFKSKKIDEV